MYLSSLQTLFCELWLFYSLWHSAPFSQFRESAGFCVPSPWKLYLICFPSLTGRCPSLLEIQCFDRGCFKCFVWVFFVVVSSEEWVNLVLSTPSWVEAKLSMLLRFAPIFGGIWRRDTQTTSSKNELHGTLVILIFKPVSEPCFSFPQPFLNWIMLLWLRSLG